MAKIIIHSFGYRHGLPEIDPSRIFDVRNIDIEVNKYGVLEHNKKIFDIQNQMRKITIEELWSIMNDEPELIDFHFYIGCECGHHKSVKIVKFLQEDTAEIGLNIWQCDMYHRDIDKPLVDIIPKQLLKKTKKDDRKRQCSCGENF